MFAFFAEVFLPPVAAVLAGMVAAALGLPQGLGFETTIVFEVLVVALAAVVLPAVVGYGLVSAVREERNSK